MLSSFRKIMEKEGIALLTITLVLAMTIGTMAGCGKEDNVTVMLDGDVSRQSVGDGEISIPNMEEPDDSAAYSSLSEESGRETSIVLTVMKEGMPEEIPATLYVGEGYSLYLPDGDWDNFVPDAWQAEKNNQVHFGVENYEGINKSQVERILTEQGYAVENGELWMQDSDIICRIICYETKSDVWTVNFAYPCGESGEGWLPLMRAMAGTFAVDADYDVGAHAENAVMPEGEDT